MARPYHVFKYDDFNERKNRVSRETEGKAGFTIIAHRGASAYYPENTMAAFQGAMDMEADMVELDVQLTSDGEIVVFHDEKISRCTNGRGRIAGYSYDELKKLDAGSWFDKKFAGARVPALRDVLDLCKARIAVNIEIKTEAVTDVISGGIEEKCLRMVEQVGMREHVVFSSFDPRAVLHLRQIDHQAPAAILFEKKYHGSMLPSQIIELLGADAFNCSRRELGRKWLADLKHHGIPVNVYTVNDEKNMNRLLSLGVDGMFTNHPDVLKRVLEDFRWKQRVTGNERRAMSDE
jgi:glycerophosphoryl diester phosphodiesterase